MVKINIERLLHYLFNEDYNNYKDFSLISQLGVITIKSLMPMINEQANRIDYTRFSEEMKLWESYRIGNNSSLLNAQGRGNSEIYWNERDDSIISRIIPIVLVNQDYNVVEDEIIKNILYSSGNLIELFESITIGNLLYLVINNEGSIIDKLKTNIIGFSQVEFVDKYKDYYKIDIKDYAGNFKVEFEKQRIYLLNTLHGIKMNKYMYLEDCINILNNEKPTTFIGNILYNYLNELNIESNIPKFYINLGEYVLKLRKSRVDPELLEIKEYILPDIFSFKEGEVFFHSLLKESKIIKKEVKNNNLTSLVQTRTGIYLFKKIGP